MNQAAGLRGVTKAFDRLGIRYFVAGSLASSVHGVPRTTMDVDLVADIRPEQAERFAAGLGSDFYADADTIREALSVKAK